MSSQPVEQSRFRAGRDGLRIAIVRRFSLDAFSLLVLPPVLSAADHQHQRSALPD